MHRLGKFSYGLVSVVVAVLLISGTALAGGGSTWVSAGHDLQNTRYQNTESKIGAANVANLAVQWQFTTGGDVSATPAVDGSKVYFPDWAGNLYALDQKTGTQVWSHKISDYTGIAGDYARTTPALVGNYLIFGDQGGKVGGGAWVMAVKKTDGSLVWKTQVESADTFPTVTQSAVIDASANPPVAYVGISSFEEAMEAFIPGYTCCKFRGSILALNANTGQRIWQTYTVPAGPRGDSYTGGSVWGSTPVIDYGRNSLYISTGNNYSVPVSVQACVAAATDPATTRGCISPDDHFDSVMALDLKTGAIKWTSVAIPFDSFVASCVFPSTANPGNCPTPAGPDYDFGQGPMLFTVRPGGNGKPVDLLGAGQKSGQFWAFNPDTGAVVWVTQVGAGGTLGGLEWGSATDGNRIYVAISNSEHKPWAMGTNGGWSALDPVTGQILWQTADPTGGIDPGAVSVANGVVFGCSLDAQGHMYGFDAATGRTLWSFASGGSCNSGAAISNGVVYWGSGYSNFGLGTPNNKFYAFKLP